jgi:hypothetical protein
MEVLGLKSEQDQGAFQRTSSIYVYLIPKSKTEIEGSTTHEVCVPVPENGKREYGSITEGIP